MTKKIECEYCQDECYCPYCGRDAPEGYVTKTHMDERIAQAVAAARKSWAQQATIPEGYALVPTEPTKQMLIAMVSNSGEDLEEMEEKYKAAIAVAQEGV